MMIIGKKRTILKCHSLWSTRLCSEFTLRQCVTTDATSRDTNNSVSGRTIARIFLAIALLNRMNERVLERLPNNKLSLDNRCQGHSLTTNSGSRSCLIYEHTRESLSIRKEVPCCGCLAWILQDECKNIQCFLERRRRFYNTGAGHVVNSQQPCDPLFLPFTPAPTFQDGGNKTPIAASINTLTLPLCVIVFFPNGLSWGNHW